MKGNIELAKNLQVCYALAPRCGFMCDTTVPGQTWRDSAHPKKVYIPVKTKLVWLVWFFLPSRVLLGTSCGQHWSEGHNDSSWLVRWGRFGVQSQGCNMLWDKLMRLGFLRAGTHSTAGVERLPWIGASQQARATSTGSLLLSCVWTISEDTATWKHSSKCKIL